MHHRGRWLPAAALAVGVPPMLAGMLVATDPAVLVGPHDDTVRTHLVDRPPDQVTDQALTDERLGLLGAHPVTDPGATALEQALATSGRDRSRDRSRGVPVRVSGTALPARVLLSYRAAAADLARSDPACHLPWSLLAGIGQVESGHAYGGAVDRAGRTLTPILGPVLNGAGDVAAIPDTDGGRWDGDTTWDRAVGPMQFIPSSWAVWGRDGDGNGTANPSDVDDASLAAASYLCAGDRDLRVEKDRRSAVFSYNHSWDYVDLVLAYADAYATGNPVVLGPDFGTRGPAKGKNRGADGGTVVTLPSPTPTGTAGPGGPASAAPLVEPAPGGAAGAPAADQPAASGSTGSAATAAPGPEPSPADTSRAASPSPSASTSSPSSSSPPASASSTASSSPSGSTSCPASSATPTPTDTASPSSTASPAPTETGSTAPSGSPSPSVPSPTPTGGGC